MGRRSARRVSARDRIAVRGRAPREARCHVATRRGLHLRERATCGALRNATVCTTATCAASRCLPDSPRRGLLGQGSLLTITSAPNRTSPVVRGAWIVQNLLGAAVPSPPPGAAADLAKEAVAKTKLAGDTVRERLEMHRANPTCAVCHAIMDPVGLALENFDLVGRWREQEDGHAVNAATQLTDGTSIAGAADLRRALLSRSDAFVAALTERLMTYALGRELDYYDRPVARKVVRDATAHGRSLAALVQAIVASDSFQKRVKIGAARRRRPTWAPTSSCGGPARSNLQEPNHALPDRQASFAAHAAARRRRHARATAARVDDPRRDQARVGGGRAARSARVHLYSARLRDESLGADGDRKRVRVPANLEIARAVSRPAERRERAQANVRVCRRVVRGRESRPLVAVLAHVLAAGHRPDADVRRPSRGAADRPGHRVAVARARARARRVDRVSDAADAAADGGEPSRRVRAPARRRQHRGRARGTSTAALEPARFRCGRRRRVEARPARLRPRAARRLSHRTSARSSAGSRSRRTPLSQRSTCPTSRTASRPISRSTRC